MKALPCAALIAASLFAAAAWAQTSSQPLNLKLPPSDLPAASASTARPASSAPGVYYGDTSGRMGADAAGRAALASCDDASYAKPQVHGSVGMGVMSGSHMSGNYQTGTVAVSKNLGDCDDPKGAVSFSIGVGQGRFHGRGW